MDGERERELFDALADKHPDVRALDYSGPASQRLRFDRMCEFRLTGRSMLDVGCGYADLPLDLLDHRIPLSEYLGVEISPTIFARIDRKRFEGVPFAWDVVLSDVFTDPALQQRSFDVVLALGSLNYDRHRLPERLGFLWERVAPGGSLIFTQPSTLAVPVAGTRASYSDPLEVLAFCFTLSRRSSLDHYLPHEFIVEVRRPATG